MKEVTLDVALGYHQLGYNLVPIADKEKKPACASWARWQKMAQTEDEVRELFAEPRDALGFVTGWNGLVAVDFDRDGQCFGPWMDKLPPELRDNLVIETSRSGGGRHVWVRVENPPRNERWACDGEGPLIETRGRGGYCLVTPSVGQQLLQGSFDAVPLLPDAEYETLKAVAASFNATVPASSAAHTTSTDVAPVGSRRPGDIFNTTEAGATYFRAKMTEAGWKHLSTAADGSERWRRPGKDDWSNAATMKWIEAPDGTGRWVWYQFSTSTAELEADRAHSIFGAYVKLFHGGDFGAAAAHLAAEGFCEVPAVEPLPTRKSVPGEEPLRVAIPRSGLIGTIADTTDVSAARANPALSMAGGLMFVSHLAGLRRMHSEFGDRPNLCLMAVAPSAAGKSFPLATNTALAAQLNLGGSVIGDIGSGPGLEDAIAMAPRHVLLVQLDEFHKTLAILKGTDPLAHQLASAYLRLSTSSNGVYPTRRLSQRQHDRRGPTMPDTLDKPHLSVFSLGIPTFTFSNLGSDMMSDGFVGRFLLVESPDRGTRVDEPKPFTVPREFIERLYRDFVPPPFTGAHALEQDGPIVPFTDAAKRRRRELLEEADRAYAAITSATPEAEARRSLVGRCFEKASKLALVLAISDSPEKPVIDVSHLETGWEIAWAATQRLCWLGENFSSRNEFDEASLRLQRTIREVGGRISRAQLLRRMHETAKSVDEVLTTLQEAGIVVVRQMPSTGGRPGTVIELL